MADFESVKEAVLLGTPKAGTRRRDVLLQILTMNKTELKTVAKKHGDHDLDALCNCVCLDRLRRMAAVNANEAPEQSSYDRFKNLLFGVKDENPPTRRRPRRRRR